MNILEFSPYLTVVLGLVALVYFLVLRVKKATPLAVMIKSLVSFLFMATAAASLAISRDYFFSLLILLGLLCGLIGDIVLDVMVVYPQDTKPWRYSGMTAFTIGHIFYMIAIYTNMPAINAGLWAYALIPVILGIIVSSVAVLGASKMGLNYGPYKAFAATYAFLLSFMVGTTGVIAYYSGWPTRWLLMFVGSIMFLVSDLILSQQYFGPEKLMKSPLLIITNHFTYYLAQFLIALSILFVA